MMSSSIKDVLLSWHRSFVGKKKKKPRRATPLCLFICVYLGPYGRREIGKLLKTPRRRIKQLNDLLGTCS